MIAVQKEIMRFRPTSNFGLPHAVTEDSKNTIFSKYKTHLSDIISI
jgi:hypothetical protein